MPKNQKKQVRKTMSRTPGRVSVALTSGAISVETAVCQLKPTKYVSEPMIKITMSVGVRASKERATDGGTCSGMVILNLELFVKRNTLIAMKVTIMPTNRPPPPRLAMGSTKPATPASASAATLTGVKVSRNAMTDRIPPETPSRL